ncbi:hypothetical protein CC2G_010827 [Coprinopsis cinerea AmutBmut pab1-1]|nr:hypothetical protein CC2G_010827 [Coprinopsis cinerea AmutBmut pab1-1]
MGRYIDTGSRCSTRKRACTCDAPARVGFILPYEESLHVTCGSPPKRSELYRSIPPRLAGHQYQDESSVNASSATRSGYLSV